jgi:hypothetical protein
LGAQCELSTYNCQIMAFIYITVANIRCHSYSDHFVWQNFVSGATWGHTLSGGDANSLWTYLPGQFPHSSYPGPIFQGNAAYTVSSSSTNTVTNKLKVIVGGTTYYLLASTSAT